MSLFTEALWIGLAIAAPVGPIGLLVIQRTLAHGRGVGLATGLGAALADAVYGAIGAYGVAGVIALLQAARLPLALAGGAVLLWLAWKTWHAVPTRAEPSPEASVAGGAAAAARAPGLGASLAATFVLTLSNPATIFSFVAIFGTMAARGAAPGTAAPALMVAGVLVGSALWWLLLSAGVAALRGRFDARWQRLVNRVSALALAAFALWQWAGLLR